MPFEPEQFIGLPLEEIAAFLSGADQRILAAEWADRTECVDL